MNAGTVDRVEQWHSHHHDHQDGANDHNHPAGRHIHLSAGARADNHRHPAADAEHWHEGRPDGMIRTHHDHVHVGGTTDQHHHHSGVGAVPTNTHVHSGGNAIPEDHRHGSSADSGDTHSHDGIEVHTHSSDAPYEATTGYSHSGLHTHPVHTHDGAESHKHVHWTPRSTVMAPVRGASGAVSYTVTVPQRPAAGQTLSVFIEVDPRHVDGPAGSVSVSPERIDVTSANWQQDHTVTVTASADALAGDWFVIRHRFSAGFADTYIAAYERAGLLWASIPRFDVTGRVSDAPVQDSPAAVPEASVAGAVSGEEGTDAQFVLAAQPSPAAPLAVTVEVSQSGEYAAAGEIGRRGVTIPVSGSVTVSVATVDDAADEPDGEITLTVRAGHGYRLGTPASFSADVFDNDPPPAIDDQQQQQPGADTDAEAQDDADTDEQPPAEAVPQCDVDAGLLATVEAKIVRHRDVTGRADLVTEFTVVRDALTGDGPLAAARGYADRRDGANALWAQISAHLRGNCR